jgi:GT2 family glycosyltransferase
MMFEQSLVSVITVNFKQTEVTLRMLQQLRKSSWKQLEVILVDNAAESDDTGLFEAAYPGIRVIRSIENRGFAGGNNLGLAVAKGDYLFLLNNDAFVEEDTIATLVGSLQSQATLGAVSPKIKYFGTNTIQYAGFSPISRITGRSIAFGKWQEDNGQCNRSGQIAYTHGAAMMLTRAAFEQVGDMDESYFLYYEELDWCERIRKAGFDLFYEPKATVYHAASASTGVGSPFQLYYLTRNRILFQHRWSTTFQFIFSLFYLTTVCLIKYIKFVLSNKSKHARSLVKAYRDALSALSYQAIDSNIKNTASEVTKASISPI